MIYTNEVIKQKNARKARIKKVIRSICLPIIIAIVLLAIYICYSRFIKNDNNINIFGFKQYIVATGSMEPNYNIGDLIIVKQAKEDDIKINDVITYSVGNGGETISHRVIDTEEQNGQTYYKTKGDNNNSQDEELVNYNQIQGKVVYKISKLGVIITKITTGTGIIIILLIAILSYIYTNRKEEKRIAREDARKRYNIQKYEKEETI